MGASVAAGKEVRPLYLCTVSQRPVVSSFALPDHNALGGESGAAPRDDGQPRFGALTCARPTICWEAPRSSMITPVRQSFPPVGDALQFQAHGDAGSQYWPPSKPGRISRRSSPPRVPRRQQAALSPEELQYLNSCTTLGLVEGKAPEHGGLLGHLFKYPWTLVRWVLWGSNAKTGGLAMLPGRITLADLYPHLRTELAAAILEAVRTENVEPLYRSPEARNRVAMEIQRIMSRSVQIFGIAVDRVAAFRFICPEYEALLAHRGQLTLDRAELSDRTQEAEIGQVRREIEAGDARHASTTQKEIETHIASDKAACAAQDPGRPRDGTPIRRASGRAAAAGTGKGRHLPMNTSWKKTGPPRNRDCDCTPSGSDNNTSCRTSGERQQLRLQDGASGWISSTRTSGWTWPSAGRDGCWSIQNSERDAGLDRRIKMIELYAKLPKDSVLTIALAENPQLAAAYAESMRAQNQQETVQMQERFRAELAKAYANNNQQFAMLLQEAVQQWGQYQAAKQIGQQPPQQVINVALPRPAEGPPSLPGEDSPDSSP